MNIAVPDTEDGTLIAMPPELGAASVSIRKDNTYLTKVLKAGSFALNAMKLC